MWSCSTETRSICFHPAAKLDLKLYDCQWLGCLFLLCLSVCLNYFKDGICNMTIKCLWILEFVVLFFFLILTLVTRAENTVYPETCLRLTQEYSLSLFYFTVIFSKLVLLILLSGLGISLQQAVNPLSLSACQMLNWH